MDNPPALPTSFPLQQITAEALDRQYAGLPTEAEAKRLTKKYFSIPKELEALADLLVQDSRVLYRSFEDLARHALYELLKAYYDSGYPNSQLGAELEYEHGIRLQAYRAARRKVLTESMHQFDDELDAARRQGDWKYIVDHLGVVESWIKEAPTESVKHNIRASAVQSLAIQAAVVSLLDMAEQEGVPKDVGLTAEAWREALEEWQGDL
ncbi:hypothetical protein LCGC14_1978800 [marine sediment metagenome]|uniref:Uncharacterized protein n=1 Tax=marine sediment metagenome TaxID=412755 RepID=A0A0F9F9I3_9ZZZZ